MWGFQVNVGLPSGVPRGSDTGSHPHICLSLKGMRTWPVAGWWGLVAMSCQGHLYLTVGEGWTICFTS